MKQYVSIKLIHHFISHVQKKKLDPYQFRVIRHVFKRIFGVLKSDKTPGPVRSRSSSLFVLDMVNLCRNFCWKDSGSSLPLALASVSNIVLASASRPLASSQRGDSGRNLPAPSPLKINKRILYLTTIFSSLNEQSCVVLSLFFSNYIVILRE